MTSLFSVQDVLQGTQLLAIDVAAAMGLLRRVIIGDELTDKEKQALRRTLTDLASVVPIGVLMLLPVSIILLFIKQTSGFIEFLLQCVIGAHNLGS